LEEVGLVHEDVAVERGEEQRHDQERAAVDGGGHVFPVTLLEVGGHQPGRKGQHGDAHQQQQVEEQDRPVGLAQAPDHHVVVDPDDPDGQERDHVGHVHLPLADQSAEQALTWLEIGQLDIEHQQRDRHRENAVGERFEPVRAHA
jgi:hypothetical protein